MSQSVEIIITCHNFQHRLNWMLSSIVDQYSDEVPIIIVNVAHVKNNGNPTVEDLAHYFFHNHGLEFRLVSYENTEELQYRGLARNRQISVSKADWLLFADCDMVYSYTFWSSLKIFIDRNNEAKEMLHLGRYSCDQKLCDEIITKYQYPTFVRNTARMCSIMPMKEMMNCGAGYFQLIRRDIVMKELGGIYVKPEECKDYSWEVMQKAKSDVQFRKRTIHRKFNSEDLMKDNKHIDKILNEKVEREQERKLELWEVPCQFHLNHARDNVVGYHLETQR